MNNNLPIHSDSVGSKIQPKPVLKIGIDAHAVRYVIATQIDGAAPKPAQAFDLPGLLRWVRKKLEEGYAVFAGYEAGPFGYGLHRQLLEMGATNYVIRPRNWDDQSRRVKTDRVDARAMLGALNRYLAGNPHALCIVRVPTIEQERRRSLSRVREGLQRDLKAIAQRGRSLALQYGYSLKGEWFGPRRWPGLLIPDWLRELLAPLRHSAWWLWQEVQQLTQQLEAASSTHKPVGIGGLTEQVLDREMGDWSRFKNRRQVASFAGLCPSEHSSGGSQHKGHITKAGNARVRWIVCQAVWRLLRYQPDYWLIKKWKPRLEDLHTTRGRRKQIITAIARGFAIDWWRWRTGQTTPDKLGWAMTA